MEMDVRRRDRIVEEESVGEEWKNVWLRFEFCEF